MLGAWELVIIFLVVLLLFGGKKLPELARSLGTGIREFKKASQEVSEEIERPLQAPKEKKLSKDGESASLSASEK